ncbi:MAG TPA: formate dehydrogenase subunit gamma [Thermoanaerobaculia bacterium]|nr:formate dehydrogenase subunit gamma [Thermoanaerobaculia bacterium]
MSDSRVLPNGRIVRYAFDERLMHFVAAVSYVYLLLTGLAFWTPWLFWIAVVLGGGTISRILHPWVGVIFVISVIWMYVKWASQMRTTENDRAWWRAVGHYTRNEDEEVPPVGRFNAGQKVLFWVFFWCGILLFLSGLVLWVPHWIPWGLRYLRFIAVLVHVVSALLTIALFMIHVYMGTAVERGAYASITRGDVSRAWAHRHHRAWYDQIAGDPAAKR